MVGLARLDYILLERLDRRTPELCTGPRTRFAARSHALFFLYTVYNKEYAVLDIRQQCLQFTNLAEAVMLKLSTYAGRLYVSGPIMCAY